MKLLRFQTALSFIPQVMLTVFVLLVTQMASAAVDQSQCPDAGGRYKQNGKSGLITIEQGTQQGRMIYTIEGVRYTVDGLDRQMADGKTSYMATCLEDELIIKVEKDGRTNLIRLEKFAARGTLRYRNQLAQSAGEQSLVAVTDQVLTNVDQIKQFPPHKRSQCPTTGQVNYSSTNNPDLPNDRIEVISEMNDDGVQFYFGDRSWMIDSETHQSRGVSYKGACYAGEIYLYFYSDAEFVSSLTYVGVGKGGRIDVIEHNISPSGRFKMYSYSPDGQ